MSMRDDLARNLRVQVPTLEPDDTFLAMLAELSRTAPAPRPVVPRILAVTATAAALSTRRVGRRRRARRAVAVPGWFLS